MRLLALATRRSSHRPRSSPPHLARAARRVSRPAPPPRSVRGARSSPVASTRGGESTSWHVEYGKTTRLRLAHGRTERRQRHERRRRDRAASRPRDRRHLPLPRRRLERLRLDPRRRRDVHDPGTARGRDRAASLLGPSAATVGGTVDPNGRTTGWWIEYGTSTRYGSRTDTRSAGAGTSPVGVSVRLEKLQAGVDVPLPARRVERPRHACAAPTGRSAPILRRRSRRAASTGSASRPRASTGSSTRAGAERSPGSSTGRRTKLGNRTPDQAGREPGADLRARSAACSPARATTSASSPGATQARRRARPARFSTSAGPLATTGAAQVSGASVVLTGSVDPVGRATEWWFELGPSTVVRHVDRRSQRGRRARRGRGLGDDRRADAGRPSTTSGSSREARPGRRGAPTPSSAPRASRSSAARARRRSRSREGLDRAPTSQTSGLETRVWVELGRGGALYRRSNVVRAPARGDRSRVSIRVGGLAPGRALHLPDRRDERRRHRDRDERLVRHGRAAARRARASGSLHDRRDERPRPPRRDARPQRDLRPRRQRRDRRARAATTSSSEAPVPTTSCPVLVATACSAGSATTSSSPATAGRTSSSAGSASTAAASTVASTSLQSVNRIA